MIKDLISLYLRKKEVSQEEKYRIFSYLRHIPNARKTEEEWDVYKILCKEKGLPEPDRKSIVRPLHEIS